MKRKLVQQGAATMMISLPSKWIKANSLGKGDEVDVEEREKEIVIYPHINSEGKRKLEITLSSFTESSIRTILTRIYREGYDNASLKFGDKYAIKIIEDTVEKQLLGFEVIKKTENSCIIENITEPSKEQFNNIFGKMLLNIEDLIAMTKKMILGERAQEFEQTEDKIKQFDNFCRRIIAKENLEKEELTLAFHTELMHSQRELYYLLKFLEKNKVKSGKNEIDSLEECKKMFEMLREAYFKKDLKIIEKMHEFEKEVYKKGYLRIEKSNAVIIHHLLNAIRGFYLTSSPLIGLLL